MKRTQIYLSEQQHEILRKLAFEQHKSISQVIRDMIDQFSKKSVGLANKPSKYTSHEKKRTGEETIRSEEQDKVKNRIGKALESDQIEEAREITESLKGLVSEEKYNQLTTALKEYRKSLEKLKRYSQE